MPKVEEAEAVANLVKSRNRLVGEIMNNDLYGDDDDGPLQNDVHEQHLSLRVMDDAPCNDDGQVLDLGLGAKSNAPKK